MSAYPLRAFLLVTTSPLGLAAPITKGAREAAGRRAAYLALIAFDPESVRIAPTSPELSKRRRSKIEQAPAEPKRPKRPRNKRKGRRAIAQAHRKARGEE